MSSSYGKILESIYKFWENRYVLISHVIDIYHSENDLERFINVLNTSYQYMKKKCNIKNISLFELCVKWGIKYEIILFIKELLDDDADSFVIEYELIAEDIICKYEECFDSIKKKLEKIDIHLRWTRMYNEDTTYYEIELLK